MKNFSKARNKTKIKATGFSKLSQETDLNKDREIGLLDVVTDIAGMEW